MPGYSVSPSVSASDDASSVCSDGASSVPSDDASSVHSDGASSVSDDDISTTTASSIVCIFCAFSSNPIASATLFATPRTLEVGVGVRACFFG
jgi:hypothetical protein